MPQPLPSSLKDHPDPDLEGRFQVIAGADFDAPRRVEEGRAEEEADDASALAALAELVPEAVEVAFGGGVGDDHVLGHSEEGEGEASARAEALPDPDADRDQRRAGVISIRSRHAFVAHAEGEADGRLVEGGFVA